MKKLEEKRSTFILAYGLITSIIGLIIYPVLDLFFCKFITNSKFEYSVSSHVLSPITFGIFFSIIYSFAIIKKR